MSFSRSVLVMAGACVACGGPPASVRSAKLAEAQPATPVLPLVPAEALGAYHGGDGFFVELLELDQRLLLLIPGRRALAVQANKSATGIDLLAPAELMNAPDDEPQLPNEFVLVAPASGHPNWQLESRVGTLTQRPNPLATELATNLKGRELRGVNDEGVRLQLTQEALTFPAGRLLSLASKDENGAPSCDLAVIVPDPTENRSRPWLPFARPPQGQLGSFSYIGLVLQSGAPGSCNRLDPSRAMYPVRHGIYFFRLLADSRLKPQGALFLGYMAASLFVAPDIARKDLAKAIQAMSEEISSQAE